MGGVDLCDQLRKYYYFGPTGNKWWRYIFWFVLNIASVNSFLLYKHFQNSNDTKCNRQSVFRHALAKQLVGGSVASGYRITQKRKIEAVLDIENIPGHKLVRLGKKLTCVFCRSKGIKTPSGRGIQSTFGCNICSVALCKTCFPNYHGALLKNWFSYSQTFSGHVSFAISFF